MRTNAMIEDIGLFVLPHYGSAAVEATILLEAGGTCRISIPSHKINEFIHLFVYDNDYDEDGFYLHHLQGKYVRVNIYNNNITKIGHITKNKWFDLKEFFKWEDK